MGWDDCICDAINMILRGVENYSYAEDDKKHTIIALTHLYLILNAQLPAFREEGEPPAPEYTIKQARKDAKTAWVKAHAKNQRI